MSNFGSLNTAYTGLSAHRRALDIIAHNVANSSTEGYHRQRAELVSLGGTTGAGVFSGRSQSFGVDVVGVTRSYDQLLAARAVKEEAARVAADTTSASMTAIEGIFPEPSDTGLASALDVFWSSWGDLANDPGGLASRTQLLENAQTLATSINRTSTQLQGVADSARTRMSTLASEVNDLATQLADLNRSINATHGTNSDLLDQRDLVVSRISDLTGGVARPGDSGAVDVYVGGRALVTSTIVQTMDGTSGVLRWESDNAAVNPTSGEAQALTAVVSDVVPRYQALLDGVANSLVTNVNALHSVAYDQAGTTGRNFFDPAGVTGATIALSTDVAGQPANIAAGAPVLPGPTAPGPLDGEQARLIAALADSATGPDRTYQSMVTTLAVETRAANNRATIQEQIADTAVRDADSVGAVSIDEEMAMMISAQRAFEANARVMTVVDEMLGFLIERTGTVGR